MSADLLAELPAEPALLRCEHCGREWRWIAHRTRDGVARWCAPKLAPCAMCASSETAARAQDAREVLRRLSDAGIPEPLQRHQLDRDHIVSQAHGEDLAAFVARVVAANQDAELRGGPFLTGVAGVNADGLRRAWTWAPPRWLVLHGPPGTGKSAWMAGLARRLLTRKPDEWRGPEGLSLPGQRTLVRRTLPLVRYVRVDELCDRLRARWRGDPNPTLDYARVQVLLLDELGADPKPSEVEIRAVEQVLCYRADRHLGTVIATNRGWPELVGDRPLYGRRVGDRLNQAIQVAIGGPSWRT